ncbi:hypothetical protein MGWOODY_Smn1825 [hydrothermal vent metagenome]|uniref:Glycosyltransferase RgtA/B/C/D-like domain-containing protein n=1 Tax=hydrothermal vent metagenome TaxID=652676 RepID=A0A160TNT5_9ZZZZ
MTVGRGTPVRLAPARFAIAALLLCCAALAIWWPGAVEYDSVEQYKQVLSGAYLDWHPPAMARLWAVLHPLGPGATPMFVVQFVLYWLGLGLLAAALARSGRARPGAAVLALGALPLFAGWQAAVLKDTQMLGAIVAATGLAGWWRLAGRRMPIIAMAAVAALLVYAMLVRANAVFAVVPLVVMLVPWPMRLWQRGPAIGAGQVVTGIAAYRHRGHPRGHARAVGLHARDSPPKLGMGTGRDNKGGGEGKRDTARVGV